MKIAGLLPTSLQDYPDQIAAVLFTQGCNFHCPYCHNPELIGGRPDNSSEAENEKRKDNKEKNLPFYEEKEIINLLKDRTDYLDGVVITGGEPTLQPDLAAFLEKLVRDLGYKIKLDTNGSRPQVLRKLIADNLLDMVGWDYKLPLKRYQELTSEENMAEKVIASGKILADSSLNVEIRTTVVPGLLEKQDILQISQEINDLDGNIFPDNYILQEFRPDQVLDCDFSTLSPYPREVMEEFKKLAEKYLKNVNIRKSV